MGADFVARQARVVAAVTATGAELHKHYVPGIWLPHCSLAPRAMLAQLPVVVGSVLDVLPLHARLDRAALVNSATGRSRRWRRCRDWLRVAGIVTADAVWCLVVAFKVSNNST
ncbi:hypothetical protein I553_2353 [Mycobacterium xenopi 4042]|uniref:Uncharacterized protein n=1 Tax=Mycobacterium xenopi 4042 TaxID=1299334 RepID=X8AME3_MYCXE|nr:hypothetical protein I553_2353 [Mycobacterium xenopi 4042]